MSTEGILGARKLRKIKAITGIDPVRGWAWHPVWEFCDAEDRHFVVNPRTREFEQVANPLHYTSCSPTCRTSGLVKQIKEKTG